MGFWTSRRPARVPAVAVAVLVGVLGGCGSAAPQLLDESARAGLQTRVENIRSALGDRSQATAALDRFRTEVRRLRDGGDLAAADARVLLAHADQIEQRVRAESPLPTRAPVVVEPPKDEPEEEDDKRDEDRGGEGKDDEKPEKNENKGKKKGDKDD